VIKHFLLALVTTFILAQAANAADVIYPDTQTSIPSENQGQNGINPVLVEQGKKGILFKMGCWDNALTNQKSDCWPLLNGTPALTINGGAAISCIAGLDPGLNSCGYTIVDGLDNTPPHNTVKNTFKIIYNSNFPNNASVAVTLTGATGSAGSQESPNCPASSDCILTFFAGANAPRSNASLELVFDISGSMGTAVPNSSTKRIDGLKEATGILLDVLPSHAMLGDKLGVTYFSTAASGAANTAACPNIANGVLASAVDPACVGAIRADVLSQSPTNNTSIGAGLTQANSAALSQTPGNRNFVLLFSDGDQNTAPLVDQDPNTCALAGNKLSLGGTPYPPGITVCTVATGSLSACGTKLQQNIGNLGCPSGYLFIQQYQTDADFKAAANTAFTQVLNNAMVGDKLEIVRDIRGTLAPLATQSETFLGNKGDVALSLMISWFNLPRSTEGLTPKVQLIAPDGTVVDTTAATILRPGSSVTTLHFPLRQGTKTIDPEGQWKIEATGLNTEVGTNYQILVVADNNKLASEARAPVADPGTGEPIALEVKLTEGGVPIPGATVAAALDGPQNGLGDALAKAANPAGAPNLNGDLPGSAARAKLDKLLSDPAFAALLKDQSLPSITLTADAGGVYRGSFGGTTKEGNYQFSIVEAGSSTVGKFERTQKLTVFVRPKPDAAHTDVSVVSTSIQPDNSVIVKLRAVARDRFGSMIGPDYGTAFQIRSSIGTIETPLGDTLDGGYTIAYRLPSNSTDPVISVNVMGDTVTSSPLSNLPGSAVHAGSNFLWWIVAILLLLIAVYLIVRFWL
jgi:hypothetical protein